MQSGGQLWKQCKKRQLVGKLATNASGAIWWPNLQLMQVAPSCGQISSFPIYCLYNMIIKNVIQGDKYAKLYRDNVHQASCSSLQLCGVCGYLLEALYGLKHQIVVISGDVTDAGRRDGRRGKTGLLSFWSVRSWVSPFETLIFSIMCLLDTCTKWNVQ